MPRGRRRRSSMFTPATRTGETLATSTYSATSSGRSASARTSLIQTTNGIGVRRDPVTGEAIWPTDEERLALVSSSRPPTSSASPPARRTSLPGRGLPRRGAVYQLAALPQGDDPGGLCEGVDARVRDRRHARAAQAVAVRRRGGVRPGAPLRLAPLRGRPLLPSRLSPGISPMCSSRARSYSQTRPGACSVAATTISPSPRSAFRWVARLRG